MKYVVPDNGIKDRTEGKAVFYFARTEVLMKRILEYRINSADDGRTIKDFLTNRCRMSGTLIKNLKMYDDGITVNGDRKFVTHILHNGDMLKISIYDEPSENIIPVKLDFEVIYEDEDIIIVNKPPHMPTHPSPGNIDNTLANALMYYWREKGEEHVFRAVNRLDKDTSGVMCIAKNSYSHALLCDEIKTHTLKRRYTAIVCGTLTDDGTICEPIKRESFIKRCVANDGQRAVTHYKVIETKGGYSLVSLELETGRTHQIRVHMSHIGCPLLGDWLYGEENHSLFDRQALHSCYLELVHPVSKEKIEFHSELYPDMRDFWDKL